MLSGTVNRCLRASERASVSCGALLTASRRFATHGVGESGPREGGAPRFYKIVSVAPLEEKGKVLGYEIKLDDRVLKTPARRPLILPNAALAHAIAAEWEMQRNRIQPFTMPLMSLAATAADAPRPREDVEEALVSYLNTDLLLCREESGDVATLQALEYDPVLNWLRKRTGAKLAPCTSIFGGSLPQRDLEMMARYLQGFDQWKLTAVEQLAAAVKSTLLGIATIEGRVGVPQALRLSRLEEIEQIKEWGLVEGAHDIDEADAAVRVSAPSVFIRLLSLRG